MKARVKRYVVTTGRPKTAYEVVRAMGFSVRESRKMVQWAEATVARIIAAEGTRKR